jgi:ubiquitin-like protein Pup
MGVWKGSIANRSNGRPPGIKNKSTKLSEKIDTVLKDNALEFVRGFVKKALEGSAMHERMYWEELFKQNGPLIQMLIQQHGDNAPSLTVNFTAAQPQPNAPRQSVTIDADMSDRPSEPAANVVALPLQRFIRSKPAA